MFVINLDSLRITLIHRITFTHLHIAVLNVTTKFIQTPADACQVTEKKE